MLTTPFSEQLRHRTTTVKHKLDELLDQLGVMMAANYVKYDDAISNFTGILQVNGDMVLTASDIDALNIARYTDVTPTFTDDSALGIPFGADANRPACGTPGYIRFNTDLNAYEGYDGADWLMFRTIDRAEAPEYSEEFAVNAGSHWEYDTWCIFGDDTDARGRIIQLSTLDVRTGAPTQNMWIDTENIATLAVKDKRFVRVYNDDTIPRTFFIRMI